MNLLTDPWLPVVRRSGRRALIRPADLTAGLDDDPIVGPAAPRPDFDGAVLQFLIGLLQTAYAPADERAWSKRYDRPPSPDTLHAVFAPHRAAFELDGDGPRFMQDLELRPSSKPNQIRQLLIDAPGDNTIKNNADTFVRGARVGRMSRASAALALFTLQINAPAGGAGHRTGLRGGGPLTTVVLAGADGTLWETCWLNILPAEVFETDHFGAPERTAAADTFPWLGPTRTSEKGGRETTPGDMHPAHVYWSTPRRIRLAFEAADAACDIDGTHDARSATDYATVPWGMNYTGPWRHPLTPAVRSKKGERINLKMNQGGVLWRDWPALTLGGEGDEPAAVITQADSRRRRKRAELRVAAFGYDMDNMKARCWYRVDMPLIHIEPAQRARFRAGAANIVAATDYMSSLLGKSALAALGGRGSPRGTALGASIAGALWRETEASFYAAARQLRDALGDGGDPEGPVGAWHRVLIEAVPRLFDTWIDIDQRIHVAPRAVVEARRTLSQHLHGKKVRQILGLPAPKTPPKPARKAR